MARVLRRLLITFVIAAFTIAPARQAFAAGGDTTPPERAINADNRPIWRSAQALVPAQAARMPQVVATTNESKTLIGIGSGSALVAGLALVGYGASSSCKGKAVDSTQSCERLALIGSVAAGAGGVTLLLWALSR